MLAFDLIVFELLEELDGDPDVELPWRVPVNFTLRVGLEKEKPYAPRCSQPSFSLRNVVSIRFSLPESSTTATEAERGALVKR